VTPEFILALILTAAQTHDVPYELLRRICYQESGLNPRHPLCGVRARRPPVDTSRCRRLSSSRRRRCLRVLLRPRYAPNPEQPDRAAHALRRWYLYCLSCTPRSPWQGAIHLFHTGRSCTPSRRDPYIQRVLRSPSPLLPTPPQR